MHGLALFLYALLFEQGAREEVYHAFRGLEKCAVLDLKIVIGLAIASVRIVGTRVATDKGAVLVMRGELLRAHEEHVLQKVGQT